MIAIPSIHKPIEDVEDLINQDELSWFFPDGTSFAQYLRDAPPGSKMGKLYDGAEIVPYDDCYTARDKQMSTGNFAAPCTMTTIMTLLDHDFSRTSKCNFYATSDVMHHMNLALALQVFLKTFIGLVGLYVYIVIPERESVYSRCQQTHRPVQPDGLNGRHRLPRQLDQVRHVERDKGLAHGTTNK